MFYLTKVNLFACNFFFSFLFGNFKIHKKKIYDWYFEIAGWG
jgi:hypothetical protein